MNEPAAVEPMPAPSEAGGRMGPAGFGYTLAQARVRAGLSIEQAAARIRLHPKQLQAIENEDLQLLPAAAYVNGFVRNYAREIGIDPTPLIDDLNSKLKLRGLGGPEPDLGAGGPMHGPLLDDQGWRQLVLAGIVIALICAGLIGVWMARSPDRAGAPASAPARTPASSPGAGAAVPSAGKSDETSQAGEGAAASVASPNPVVDASAPAPTPAAPALDSSASSNGPSGDDKSAAPPRALPASALSASEGKLGATAGSPSEAPGAPAPGAKEGRIPVATMPPPAGATGGLLLRFVERSWVEVSQPDGRVLLSHIGEAGSIELVNASAPLVLVIGRADAVKVEYHGQAVNLKPYVNATNGVARVLLAEGDAVNGGQNKR
ncbi:MAG TPA: RodZ domain-containing protein [Burkholderiaceae bacterium]|nr:RodZ domain-containing protein [Burkholderiaceae bacterium]